MRLPGHCLCQQSLTGSGRSHQQSALGQPGSNLGVFPRIVEEIHHLHQRFLGLVLACHVLEGNARLLLHINLGIALAYAQRPSGSAHLPEHHSKQYPHKHHRQHHIKQNIQDSPRIVAKNPASVYAVLFHPGREGIQIFHNNGRICHLHIAVKRICRHGRGRILRTLCIFFQGKQDLPRTLHLHCLHFIRIHMLQEFRVADLLRISLAPEQ